MKDRADLGQGGLRALKEAIAYDLSATLAFMIGARPHECYANAWSAFIECADLFWDGTFVEGWLLIECESEVLVIEHGWLIQSNGGIVDPSIILLVEDYQRVQFFPGVRCTWTETEALDGELFPRVRFDGRHGADGLGHSDYKAAYETAVQAATDLAVSSIPQKTMAVHTAQPEASECQGNGGIIVGVLVPFSRLV